MAGPPGDAARRDVEEREPGGRASRQASGPTQDEAPAPGGSAPGDGLASPAGILDGNELVPAWLVNFAELGWRILVVAAVAVAAWFACTAVWTVTASIAVAVVVAAVFAPLVLRLRAGGRSRGAAAGIVWAAAVLSIGGVLLLLALALLPQLADVVSRLEAGLDELAAQIDALGLPRWVGAIAQQAFDIMRSSGGEAGRGLLASAANVVTILILATFLVFFFLRDGDKAWLWAFQTMGAQKRERVGAAGDDALSRVGGYLRGTTVLAGLVAVSDLVFMWLLGVPLALPLAILAFLCGYIPYFGGIVATGLILIVSLASLGTGPTLLLLALLAVRGVILGYLVRPAVYGRTVNLHPALVLVALPAGFALGGLVGLFAAVPITAVLLVVADAAAEIVDPVPHPPLPGLVPAWLDRLAQFGWRILVGIALLGFVVAVLVAVPLVVLPVLLATILAASLGPLAGGLRRRGHSPSRSAATAVGGTFLVIAGLIALAIGSLVEQAPALGESVSSGAESANDAMAGHLGLLTSAIADGTAETLRTIAGILEASAVLLTITVLGSLLAFYFLRDGAGLWDRLTARLSSPVARQVDDAAGRAFEVLGGYIIGTAAISFVGAASQFVIMVLLGLPLALPVFVLSFFLCFIPYIGGFISTGLAFLIAVASGTPADVAIMLIWTVVFNIVQGNVVSPLVYGRTVHLHPAIVLVAIPAGAAVAGIAGMFLVVPAIGVVAATWRTALAIMGDRRLGPTPAEPSVVVAD